MKWLRGLAGGAALLWLLSGCSESTMVEIHEPGQYKGKSDPLMEKAGTNEHQERLANRLRMVQTDR